MARYRCWRPGFARAFAWADPEYAEGEADVFDESQNGFFQDDADSIDAWADTIFFTAELDTISQQLRFVIKGGPFGTRSTEPYLNQYSSFFFSAVDSVENDTLYWGEATLVDTAQYGLCAKFVVRGDLDSSDFVYSCDDTVTTVSIPDSIVTSVFYFHNFERLHIDVSHDSWAWQDTIPPTFIELSSFTATGGDGYVTVDWTTAAEVDNAGFNLHRGLSKDGPYAQINDRLIQAQGSAIEGASYSFIDEDVINGETYYYRLEDIDIHGRSTMHGPVSATPEPSFVDEGEQTPLPTSFGLAQNYPNPFNPTTEIRYDLPVDCRVKLEVYNTAGQKVATLVDEHQQAGYKIVLWDSRSADEVSSGIYLYRIQAGAYTATRKMVLLR